MKKILFITGTDTDVGKTRAAACILCALREQGIDARYIKPVQTGASELTSDSHEVRHAHPLNGDAIIPTMYSFRIPASPHLAAKTDHARISMSRIVRQIRTCAAESDILLVEGAGGLLVPLNSKKTVLDLISMMEARVVLVSRNALGTLNHTGLSVRALNEAGLNMAGIVLNSTRPAISASERLIEKDNLTMIRSIAKGIPVIKVSHEASANQHRSLSIGRSIIKHLQLDQ